MSVEQYGKTPGNLGQSRCWCNIGGAGLGERQRKMVTGDFGLEDRDSTERREGMGEGWDRASRLVLTPK